MTHFEVLKRGRDILAANKIEDSGLVSELLLRHALQIDRVTLYANLSDSVTSEQEILFGQLIKRAVRGEPTAYITGKREFYRYEFYVDHRVLVPRPETELIVETAIAMAKGKDLTIADIGTGCGNIAVTMARHLTRAMIFATDISASALEVARINSRRLGVEHRIHFLQGDMLGPLPGPVDMIVANLPYVAEGDIPADGPVSFEPVLALDGGARGLDKINRLCLESRDKLRTGGSILLEIGADQAEAVVSLWQTQFPAGQVMVKPDLNGHDRMAIICPNILTIPFLKHTLNLV